MGISEIVIAVLAIAAGVFGGTLWGSRKSKVLRTDYEDLKDAVKEKHKQVHGRSDADLVSGVADDGKLEG